MHKLLFLLLFISLSCPLQADEIQTGQDKKAVDDLLAIKLKVDWDSLSDVKIDRGGGYDLKHSKFEVGNFLGSLSYERFSVDWNQLADLPFGDGSTAPISRLQRYRFKSHIPYRFDSRRMILGHLGAEWAYEEESDDSVSVQGYVLYSEYLDSLSSWQLGGYVSYHPVETVVLPIVEYTYNYPFKQRKGFYGHAGFPKTQLGYFLNQNLRTEAGFFYHQAIVRLANKSIVEPGGFFQSKNWRASWKTHYRMTKRLEAYLTLQTSIANELLLYDKTYRQQDVFEAKNGFGWSLGFGYRF